MEPSAIIAGIARRLRLYIVFVPFNLVWQAFRKIQSVNKKSEKHIEVIRESEQCVEGASNSDNSTDQRWHILRQEFSEAEKLVKSLL